MRKILGPFVALSIVASLIPGHARTPGRTSTRESSSANAMQFAPAVVVDPVHLFGEPDIRIARDGATYVSGPWGSGTQRSIWEVSNDQGHSYRTLHDRPIVSPAQSATQIVGPGGGDTEISIDRSGKVYYMDLAALASMKAAIWDPATSTMRTATFTKGKDNVSGYDRQWFATWDPADPAAVRKATGYTGQFPVNYLMYDEALAAQDCKGGCESSDYTLDGVNYSDVTTSYNSGGSGNTVIDQQTGTVLQGFSSSSSHISVALMKRDRSRPDDPALKSATTYPVATLPSTQDAGCLFPVIGIDAARTAYIAWTTCGSTTATSEKGQWQTYYSFATARSGWKKWSKPIQVSRAPSSSAVMPWIVGGGKGRIAIAWYGTSDATHNPSTEDAHQPWDVYLVTTTNADSKHPTLVQQKVTQHPMHYGTICMSGAGCIAVKGNRNLADFFELTLDPRDGALSIVFDDTSNELSQNAPSQSGQLPEPVDGSTHHRGAAVVTVLRQIGGPTLFGKQLPRRKIPSVLLSTSQSQAKFDPVYGGNVIPEATLRRLTVKADGDSYVFRLAADSLVTPANALSSANAAAVDYVIRWTGPQTTDATFGARNPIYYAAVEVGRAGAPTYFAGTARSIDLCSVSACDPHSIEYPAPPYGGVAVTGDVVTNSADGDYWEIRVPASAIGNPAPGSVMESLSAYAMVRSRPASTSYTNAELQAGVAPVVVSGLCCVNVSP